MNVRHFSRILPCFALFFAGFTGFAAGCGDSAADGGGNEGGGNSVPALARASMQCCDLLLGPVQGDDTSQLQARIIEDVNSGDTCASAQAPMSSTTSRHLTPGVTIRGVGASRDDACWISRGSSAATTASRNWRRLHGRELVDQEQPWRRHRRDRCHERTFRKLHVYWDAGSVETNGAYARVPGQEHQRVIEDCEIVGAADAGAYSANRPTSSCATPRARKRAGIGSTTHRCRGVRQRSLRQLRRLLVFALPNSTRRQRSLRRARNL